MSFLGAGVLITGDESFETCLESLRNFDEVYVLTDQPNVLESARRFGAVGRVVPTPACLETVGGQFLSSSSAQWLLLIDPDEILLCTDTAALRSRLALSGPELAGYSLSYQIQFLGHALPQTYHGLRKRKLVRPKKVHWPTIIHSLPVPLSPNAVFAELPEDTASIKSELVGELTARLTRHAKWAAIEVAQQHGAPVDVRRVAEVLAQSLNEYVTSRSCCEDGVPGVLNALLHLNKQIAHLLFEGVAFGIVNDDSTQTEAMQEVLTEVANLLSLLIQRAP